MAENIFKIVLIILDTIVISITDNEIAKTFGLIAILCMVITLLGA